MAANWVSIASSGCRVIESKAAIESTNSIYSGLLRLADLISMKPNLTIPLYLITPSARRE